MQIDGIWAAEVLGYLGWERTGITFLDSGKAHGGSAEFYHYGSYVTDGQRVTMTLHLRSHGKLRQVSGKMRKKFTMRVQGRCEGDEIAGRAFLEDARSDDVSYSFRLIKVADLSTLTA